MYKIGMICLLLVTALSAMESTSKFTETFNIQKSHKLKQTYLLKTPQGFAVVKNKTVQPIKFHDIDPLLKKLNTNEKLSKFLENGYLSLSQYNNGDYKLTAKVRGLGGGPVTGWLCYLGVKAVCYGITLAGLKWVSKKVSKEKGTIPGMIAGATNEVANKVEEITPGAGTVSSIIERNGQSENSATATLFAATHTINASTTIEHIALMAWTFGCGLPHPFP